MHAAIRGALTSKRRSQHICRARGMSSQEACMVLGVDSTCSREEVRAAYLARIKEVSSSNRTHWSLSH